LIAADSNPRKAENDKDRNIKVKTANGRKKNKNLADIIIKQASDRNCLLGENILVGWRNRIFYEQNS